MQNILAMLLGETCLCGAKNGNLTMIYNDFTEKSNHISNLCWGILNSITFS